ncbi:MAG TPA: 4a-hydroxytetrahydrobiopterin dehydratase [Candidatus Paceibacterota bacterium]|jgi:4a-hydroxytetrahydrobiopterin dehydratase|nr:4a-hydroxytetrahydrobiopterin dehydratase [Candidatus Paceibacterota bacterium]
MKDLLKKKCIPCEVGGEPLNRVDAQDYVDELPGWTLSEGAKRISKEYKFQDFIGAINFVERVADVAEIEGHHPDIHVHYNKVLLELWTHEINGLSENDFIVAAKVDAMK